MLLGGLTVGFAGSLTGSFVKSLPWMLKVLFLVVGGVMLVFHVIKSPKRYPPIFNVALFSLAVGCCIPLGIKILAENVGILSEYILMLKILFMYSMIIMTFLFIVACYHGSKNNPDPDKRRVFTFCFVGMLIGSAMIAVPAILIWLEKGRNPLVFP